MLYDFAFFKHLIPLPVDGANLLHQTVSLGWSGDRWYVGQRIFLVRWLQIRLFWLGFVSGASYQRNSIPVVSIVYLHLIHKGMSSYCVCSFSKFIDEN